MTEKPSPIAINGEVATKALTSLRTFAAAPRKGKTAVERTSGDMIRLILGLKDKEEYKNGKKVIIHLPFPTELTTDEYEIVYISKGDASVLRDKLSDVPHLTTVASIFPHYA